MEVFSAMMPQWQQEKQACEMACGAGALPPARCAGLPLAGFGGVDKGTAPLDISVRSKVPSGLCGERVWASGLWWRLGLPPRNFSPRLSSVSGRLSSPSDLTS